MSELDAFEAKVRQNIKLLGSTDARIRRKAAAWLGEAGDPSAISSLKDLYEDDPDAGVRQAAGYALGMFRALESEMAGDSRERVIDMLEDIALRGKMGRRTRIPKGCMVRLFVGLLVSLAILLAFNFVVWPRYGDQLAALLGVAGMSAKEVDTEDQFMPQGPAGDLTAMLNAIRADTTTLQAAYADPAALDCAASFNNPIAYDFTGLSDQPALADLAARLNAQLVQLVTAKAPYNQACSSGGVLSPEQVTTPSATLDSILAELDAIQSDLAAAQG